MTAVGQESIDDDLFSASAIDDPYTYLGRLREADPVHWTRYIAYGSSPATTTSCT
jgi:hypothetical protein